MFVPESESRGKVAENHIVVTSDVDTFVMRPDIFEELMEAENIGKISILQARRIALRHLGQKVIIFLPQYDNTLDSGNTFAMVFIAMQFWQWKKLLIEVGTLEHAYMHENNYWACL